MAERIKMKTNLQLKPTVFAIFGGSGDLTWRKLVPSLFDLYQDLSMPLIFSIIALDRIELSDKELHKRFRDGIKNFSRKGKVNDKVWSKFTRHIYYIQGDFTKSGIYSLLKERCAYLEKEWNVKPQLIFYMATPPVMFGEIPKHLKEAGLADDQERARIVIEKPIGHDIGSALKLNKILTDSFSECQIFRIDHYLGKETVRIFLHSVLPTRSLNHFGIDAMQFNYQESFSLPIPEAYEALLWDVMKNDATLFMRADQVEAAWQIIMPILDTRPKKRPVDFPNYAAGTWGPQEADRLLKEGYHWPSPMKLSGKK
jgi:glucose-6-phosphate 1-dehydrogenase